MTNKEIAAMWDRVAHRYDIDQRDVEWLGLRSSYEQMAMKNAVLLNPIAAVTPHNWTPDESKNRCRVCGDGPWGRHRFQERSEEPESADAVARGPRDSTT